MGWTTDAATALTRGESIQVRPHGGSMRGRIKSGQAVTLTPVDVGQIKVDDVVFVRWKGNYLLHLVKEIDEGRAIIGNNVGKINGWVPVADILGKVTEVVD